MTVLVLVRHGRTVPDPSTTAASWPLAEHHLPAAVADEVGSCDVWLSSPELKALHTAALLTERPVEVDPRLREVDRGGHLDDYDAAVGRHLTELDHPAADGWETGRAARARLSSFVRDQARRTDLRVAAVTHGLAMTHLHALLTGAGPDLAWWQQLEMPDVRTYEVNAAGSGHEAPR